MLDKIIKLLLITILAFVAIFLIKNVIRKEESWDFVGYQYKWNKDYVDNNGLKTQTECMDFGNKWLVQQQSSDALFTCSNNCKDAGFGTGQVVCNQVCEYGKKGLIQCRH